MAEKDAVLHGCHRNNLVADLAHLAGGIDALVVRDLLCLRELEPIKCVPDSVQIFHSIIKIQFFSHPPGWSGKTQPKKPGTTATRW